MRLTCAVLVLSASITTGQAPPPVDARAASFGDVARLAAIEKVKGEPTQLGWSPDGSQLYLKTMERGSDGGFAKPRFFVMSISSPQPAPVEDAPEWAIEYWNWKSGKTGPEMTGPEIELATEEKTAAASQSAMGGSSYGGGGVDAVSGTTAEQAARRSEQEQKQRIITLSLKGQTVGRFVNQPLLPGYTFGWSPKAQALLAYVNEGGHLAIMDMQGRHQELGASKNAILPAWSADGQKMAYLQKTGKNRWELYTVAVATERR